MVELLPDMWEEAVQIPYLIDLFWKWVLSATVTCSLSCRDEQIRPLLCTAQWPCLKPCLKLFIGNLQIAYNIHFLTYYIKCIILPLIEILKFDWLRQILYAAILCFLTNLICLIYPLHVTYWPGPSFTKGRKSKRRRKRRRRRNFREFCVWLNIVSYVLA